MKKYRFFPFLIPYNVEKTLGNNAFKNKEILLFQRYNGLSIIVSWYYKNNFVLMNVYEP